MKWVVSLSDKDSVDGAIKLWRKKIEPDTAIGSQKSQKARRLKETELCTKIIDFLLKMDYIVHIFSYFILYMYFTFREVKWRWLDRVKIGMRITVGAQSIACLCQNLVNWRRNIWAHRRRRKLRFFLFEKSWAGEWVKILTKVNS
jgi:hypothetical protein